MNYIEPFLAEEKPSGFQIVRYSIELHKGIFTDELFELYQKYEKAVHERDVTPESLKTHLCNSPVYDPILEAETFGMQEAPDNE
jgi:hypothetical protein